LFVIIFGVVMFMKNATKVNKRDQIRSGRKLTLGSHMLYGFHIIFHPFDGFWDMKHEKRGSVLAATIYLLIACLSYVYKAIGEGFILNQFGLYRNFIGEAIAIITPVTLWVIANWCLTTLFDGEGSMKDIFMVTCYSLIPIPIIVTTCTLASHIIVKEEKDLLTMAGSIMFFWVGALLFFGVMVIHDYSLGKNVATALAVCEAMRGFPLTHRFITVSGDAIAKPANLIVPNGTPFSELIAHCGGASENLCKIICGGPMMGFAQPDDSASTTKTTSGLLLLSSARVKKRTK